MGQERPGRREAVRESLAQLGELPTVSDFVRSFYGLVCRWIEEPEESDEEVQTAFALLLRIEVRHHEALGKVVDHDTFDIASLLEIFRRTRGMLTRLLGAIRHIPRADGRREMIRQLLLAECYYHLGKPAHVVASLRHAIDLGGAHPIVSFALGYNLYCRAVQDHVRLDAGSARFLVSDATKFRHLICEAIKAFRTGLSGQPFDAQLYWWVGQLSEVIREHAAAAAAYLKAARLDPATFEAVRRKKLRKLSGVVLDASSQAESERLCGLPAITGADLEQMRRQLQEMDALPGFGDDA